jgi:hypothetical protein
VNNHARQRVLNLYASQYAHLCASLFAHHVANQFALSQYASQYAHLYASLFAHHQRANQFALRHAWQSLFAKSLQDALILQAMN